MFDRDFRSIWKRRKYSSAKNGCRSCGSSGYKLAHEEKEVGKGKRCRSGIWTNRKSEGREGANSNPRTRSSADIFCCIFVSSEEKKLEDRPISSLTQLFCYDRRKKTRREIHGFKKYGAPFAVRRYRTVSCASFWLAFEPLSKYIRTFFCEIMR